MIILSWMISFLNISPEPENLAEGWRALHCTYTNAIIRPTYPYQHGDNPDFFLKLDAAVYVGYNGKLFLILEDMKGNPEFSDED